MPKHNPEVDAWFERYDNPLKDLVLRVREAVLDADGRVTGQLHERRRFRRQAAEHSTP